MHKHASRVFLATLESLESFIGSTRCETLEANSKWNRFFPRALFVWVELF